MEENLSVEEHIDPDDDENIIAEKRNILSRTS